MRVPVAEGFYPQDAVACRKMIENFLKVSVKPKEIIGAVVPHAGYVYSGSTAAYVYKTLSKTNKKIVIFGTNHTGRGMPIAVSRDTWMTPLGNVESDEDFVDKISGDLIVQDEVAHMYEHSIEVQLPFLQVVLGKPKIVAISVSHVSFDILEKVARTIADRGYVYIASSDFTHYGSMYGFVPRGGEEKPAEFVKELDKSIIKYITSLEPKKFYKESSKTTICGTAGITLMLLTAKELGASEGKLLHYETSYSTSKNTDAIVGYAAVIVV